MSKSHIELSNKLEKVLSENHLFKSLFCNAEKINLPNWYVAGGCVTQTVWNYNLGLPYLHGLKDIDIVYFCNNETHSDEQVSRSRIQTMFSILPIPIDVINEARVHEWYPKKFGYQIDAYTSAEDGISTWLPAFSVGVRLECSKFKVFSAFGLNDMFDMIVRPNKRQINEKIYLNMVQRLQKDWPSIKVIPYNYENR